MCSATSTSCRRGNQRVVVLSVFFIVVCFITSTFTARPPGVVLFTFACNPLSGAFLVWWGVHVS
jgi:hypothetical protein